MSDPRAAGQDATTSGDCQSNPKASAAPAGYERTRDLPRLLPLWPCEVEIRTNGEHARLLARLRRALRAERRRGLSGHWTYDLARHAQLLRAYRAECAAYMQGAATSRSDDVPQE